MKTPKTERTVKRSQAAYILDCTPKTLRRAELAGHLTPIKRNCRSTHYLLSEVERFKRGEVTTPESCATPPAPVRTSNGQFQAAT